MPRKIIHTNLLIDRVNHMLKMHHITADHRLGACEVLEMVLHETNTYNGFRYLSPKELPPGVAPGINSEDPSNDGLSYEERFAGTDNTRRQYHRKEK